MSNEIQLYQRIQDPLVAIDKLGEVFAKSGMFGAEKIEQGKVLALACLSEGQGPFTILRTYHLIGGRLCMRPDSMLAEFHRIGGQSRWTKFDDQVAECLFTYRLYKDFAVDFTMEEAQRAGLVREGSAWKKFPDAMLRARCVSKALRMIAPEIVAGVYLPDERPIEAEVVSISAAAAPLLTEAPAEPAPLGSTATPSAATEARDSTAQPAQESQVDRPAAVDCQPEPARQEEPAPAPQPEPTPPPGFAELLKIIQGREEEVWGWLVERDWLKSGQTLDKISPKHLEKILARPDAFLRAISKQEKS